MTRKKRLSKRQQKIIALLLKLRLLFAMMGNKRAIRSLAILENQLGLRSEVVKRTDKKKPASRTKKKGGKKKRTSGKKKTGKKRRASKKQAANRRRFKAFIKRHGRAPRKGEKLSD